jgi:hypothetical protein
MRNGAITADRQRLNGGWRCRASHSCPAICCQPIRIPTPAQVPEMMASHRRGNQAPGQIRQCRQRPPTRPSSVHCSKAVAAIADLHGAAIELTDNKPGLRIAIRFPV